LWEYLIGKGSVGFLGLIGLDECFVELGSFWGLGVFEIASFEGWKLLILDP
jgi:hypothetical protein